MIKKMKSLSKDELLSLTNKGLEFYQFLIPELELLHPDKCKSVLNPLYDDTKPGLSIYYNYNADRWQHKDHGESPTGEMYQGDVFDFAASYYDLDIQSEFNAVLRRMARDLNIEIKEKINLCEQVRGELMIDYPYDGDSEDEYAWLMGFELFYKGANDGIDLAWNYFKNYGISKDILRQYNVRSIRKYKALDKNNQVKKVVLPKTSVCFAYVSIGFSKIYSPGSTTRFWYVGEKPKDYIFGEKEIMRRRRKLKSIKETLIITGGEKDVLTLTAMGYDAVCFNSETASVPLAAKEELFPAYERILVLFDSDATGKRKSNELVEGLKDQFNVDRMDLPVELTERGGKDVSDYVALGLDLDVLRELINSTISEVGVRKSESIFNEVQGEFAASPLIPEKVYLDLPVAIRSLCELFKVKRDRDLVLLSTLATLSSFFPRVRGLYGGKNVGCNFFLFVNAPASSGKGVMTWSRNLGFGIQRYLNQKYQHEMRQFKETNEGEMPKKQLIFIPANSSVSMMTQILDANQNFGIIFETEADTLANVLKAEWGNFTDILRKAFHHEPISMTRRGTQEYLQIDNPHVSVVLSGTEKQVENLITDVENGFFSRMLFYTFEAPVIWRDQFNEFGGELDSKFLDAAQKFLEYWKIQEGNHSCMVELPTTAVTVKVNEYFKERLQELFDEHGDYIVASVKRFSLNFYRIAMLLSVIRQLDETNELPKKLQIGAQDYESALLIIDVLFEHLEIVFQRIRNSNRTSRLNSQQRRLLESLPDSFTRSEFDAIAEKLNIRTKTAERYIVIYKKYGLLGSPKHGHYDKLLN